MPFYPNQQVASDAIIQAFADVPYVVLLAQMQSGKSGTYLLVGLRMKERGEINHIYIINGSSDRSLKLQAQKDLDESLKEYARLVGPDAKRHQNIHILFSNDLNTLSDLPDKSLVIHDESATVSP